MGIFDKFRKDKNVVDNNLAKEKNMDVNILRKKLKKAGVPNFLYNLDQKGRNDERFCLEYENGKWNVYYAERGVKTTNKFFETESEACEYIYDKLVNDKIR